MHLAVLVVDLVAVVAGIEGLMVEGEEAVLTVAAMGRSLAVMLYPWHHTLPRRVCAVAVVAAATVPAAEVVVAASETVRAAAVAWEGY